LFYFAPMGVFLGLLAGLGLRNHALGDTWVKRGDSLIVQIFTWFWSVG